MHFVESFASNCGAKISKPYIYEQYFPLPFDNYITFYPDTKHQARSYDAWKEVMDIIAAPLAKANIHIVQLGNAGEQHYAPCYSALGSASINQQAYIIRDSLLHITNDNYTVDFASGYDTKIVSLCSNISANNIRPYWSKKKRPSG